MEACTKTHPPRALVLSCCGERDYPGVPNKTHSGRYLTIPAMLPKNQKIRRITPNALPAN
jgi:hypothetical protein